MSIIRKGKNKENPYNALNLYINRGFEVYKDFNDDDEPYYTLIHKINRKEDKVMPTTVKKLIEELSKYPEDALCYAYEGEVQAVVIVSEYKEGKREELGYIIANE